MKDESIRKSLEAIDRQNIPEDINLWPPLAARLERKEAPSMNLKQFLKNGVGILGCCTTTRASPATTPAPQAKAQATAA